MEWLLTKHVKGVKKEHNKLMIILQLQVNIVPFQLIYLYFNFYTNIYIFASRKYFKLVIRVNKICHWVKTNNETYII